MANRFEPEFADSYWKDTVLSPRDIDTILDKMMDGFELFASYHYIPDKNKKMVRFILNEPQKDFARRVLNAWFHQVKDKEEPKSIMVLKSRRIGLTFVCLLLEQYIAMMNPNLSIIHLFPNNSTAEELFSTSIKEIYTGTHPQILPKNTYTASDGGSISFKDYLGIPLGSKITYSSFETQRRGTGFQILVLDEWAFAKHPEDVRTGFLNTVPKTGLALTIYISTANGINHFYDLYQASIKPDSDIDFVFYPWHEVWWNEMEPKGRLARLESLTQDEAKLIHIFKQNKYPPETWIKKLAFYDHLMKDNLGDKAKVYREWPADAEEAFTASGKPVLPVKHLKFLLEQAKAHPKFEYIDIVPVIAENGRDTGDTTWGVVENSCTKQYIRPKPGHRYIIGIDPSSGLENSDYTSMVVVDERTLETCATFYGRVEDDDSAVIAVSLGKLYNMATIVVERNMGQALINSIINIRYPRIAVDRASTPNNIKYGIRTDVNTKDEGIKRLRFFILKELWKTTDIQFLDDAMHFQYTSNYGNRQKAEAVGVNEETKEPYHDDVVMANVMVCLWLDMRRWRDYYIYRNGDRKKARIVANPAKGTFKL